MDVDYLGPTVSAMWPIASPSSSAVGSSQDRPNGE